MTFKHIKFTESEIMNSLEKLAKEKGLIEEDVVIKLASKKDNYSPTNNFSENILKLCGGLRKKGFETLASELEENFLYYKVASKDSIKDSNDGDKLIKEYHPGKSPSYGDSIYGVIENLVEEHNKILEVVNKTPTGKLASLRSAIVILGTDDLKSTASILNAVKTILAQEVVVSESDKKKHCLALLNKIPGLIASAEKILKEIYITIPNTFDYKINDKALYSFNSFNNNLNSLIKNASEDNMNFDYLRKIGIFLKSIQNLSNWFGEFYSFFSKVEHKNYVLSKKNAYENNLNEAVRLFTDIKLVLNGSKDEEVAAAIKTPDVKTEENNSLNKAQIIQKKINNKKRKLENLIYYFESGTSKFDQEDEKIAADYIRSEFLPYINNAQNYFNSQKNDEENIDELDSIISKSLNSITSSPEYNEFVKEWDLNF